jgi:hypothetical protein
MKLSLLFTTFFVTNSAAFAPSPRRSGRTLLIVTMSDAAEKEEAIKPNGSVDDKIKLELESDENSPAKIDAASMGRVEGTRSSSFDEIDETKVFDPTTLWTDHSAKF